MNLPPGHIFAGLPARAAGALLVDPPWRFRTWSETNQAKSPSKHYALMRTEEIAGLPVAEIAANDAVLFLWISWPMLPQAMQVIDSWDFVYRTCAFAWIKGDASQIDMFRDDIVPAMKLGYWTRANSEVCLLATRGDPKRLHADVRQAIVEPSREHSRKPDCIHDRIERLVAGPYVELFARSTRPRWKAWGTETTKYDTPVLREAAE